MKNGPLLSPSMLPLGVNLSFPDTLFFTAGHKRLPSPAEVQVTAGQHSKMNRPVVSFPSMKLIVKYDPTITIAEGQCLWAVRRLCPSVPAPEVYGWCQDAGETFIYMQEIEAVTLEKNGPYLIQKKRGINQQPLQDVIFDGKKKDGVFNDVESFHNWFSGVEMSSSCEDPWRPGLLDDSPIVFTHSDLHHSNILISWDDGGMPRVAAIVDWHQSGWYSAPWEFYKTRFTARAGEKWQLDFILEFLEVYRGYINWDYFVLKLGT